MREEPRASPMLIHTRVGGATSTGSLPKSKPIRTALAVVTAFSTPTGFLPPTGGKRVGTLYVEWNLGVEYQAFRLCTGITVLIAVSFLLAYLYLLTDSTGGNLRTNAASKGSPSPRPCDP